VSDFKFNPKAVEPRSEVEIAPRPADRDRVRTVTPLTDAERIAAARLRAMARSKEHNAPGAPYGWDYPDSHYQDFAGSQTSHWDAEVLVCIANILEIPKLRQSRYSLSGENYDANTGLFNFGDCPAVSIAELKATVDARIAELGLSKAKIWEDFADVRESCGQEYWRFDLQTRIQKFKAA
jgi:hypothetical protein